MLFFSANNAFKEGGASIFPFSQRDVFEPINPGRNRLGFVLVML
jgi:hypothetical protein